MNLIRKEEMIKDILQQRDKRQYFQAWEATQDLIVNKFPGCYFYEGDLCIRANSNIRAMVSFERALNSKNPIWIWRKLGIYFAKGRYVRKDIIKARRCLKNIKKMMISIERKKRSPEEVKKARNAYYNLKSIIEKSSTNIPTMENLEQNMHILPNPYPSSEPFQII